MTEEKFREIFRQYYRLVMKAAYCVLFDADLSQDICQETFLKFLEKVDTVDKTRYAEWLTVCARRKAIDFCKKAYQVHEVVTADRAEKEDTDKMAQRSDSGGKRTGFYNDDMPLRYNNDKQKKPLFSRGLSVCRLLFNSFSKLKIDENYKEKRRLFY